MKKFLELASKVAKDWQIAKFEPLAFSTLATVALENFNYDWPLDKLDAEIRQWLSGPQTLPSQMSLHNSFGQPLITLFNDDKFVVDLYFWVDFDTSIHSHGFRGAFRVLHGESLQETFQVKQINKIAEDIRIVDLSQVRHRRLIRGDVQTIAPGADLTHRVIHLINPTITLCVKTINEKELKQWNYLPNGLALQRQKISVALTKKLYFYQYLLGHNNIEADLFLHSILRELNLSTQIMVYEAVVNGELDLTDDTIDHIAETMTALHNQSQWWSYYEYAHESALVEIPYKHLQNPLERLVAHFKNGGYSLEQIQKLTGASSAEVESVLIKLNSVL